MNNHVALYIHIPFCSKKCHYCNFTVVTDTSLLEGYIEALRKEIAWWGTYLKGTGQTISTIYFGGGTPSKLKTTELADILNHVHTQLPTQMESLEFEMNPEDVTPAYLREIEKLGITRVNMGLQTFSPEGLIMSGRSHTREIAERALLSLEQSALSWGIDLILGLPEHQKKKQNKHGTLHTLEQILGNTSPHHISVYFLTIEPGTPFQRLSPHLLLSDQESLNEHREITTLLHSRGYIHYEISNWALAGHESPHNLMYWRGNPYIGIGVGASSFMDHRFFDHTKNIHAYMRESSPDLEGTTQEDDISLYNTYLLTSSRLQEGIQKERLAQFPEEVQVAGKPLLAQSVQLGYLIEDSTTFSIPEEKRILHNRIVERLII